jgi:hypothetical protein
MGTARHQHHGEDHIIEAPDSFMGHRCSGAAMKEDAGDREFTRRFAAKGESLAGCFSAPSGCRRMTYTACDLT